MLKMEQIGIFGSFQAFLTPPLRAQNLNEANFWNVTPRNVPRDSRKPNGIVVIPLGNHTDLPENPKN